jgi:hypothetical protein
MRTLTRFAAVSIIAFGAATASQGQCSQLQTTTITCYETNPQCEEGVSISIPYSAQYGFTLGEGKVSCCNGNVTSYFEAGNCEGSGSYAPLPKGPMDELASLQPLLVRNCSGGYDPFVEHPATLDVLREFSHSRKLILN